eukprot:COSAG04_NODE_1890_length_5298_cov_7.441239_1_plen_112_part_00
MEPTCCCVTAASRGTVLPLAMTSGVTLPAETGTRWLEARSTCESLFLPREYAVLRAKYSALDVDAARALARNPEGRALIAASKLAAARPSDAGRRGEGLEDSLHEGARGVW